MHIKKICLLGAGLMGNGIAQVCAQAGYEVTMRDIEQKFIASASAWVRFPFVTSRFRFFLIVSIPLSINFCSISRIVTSYPA